MASSQHGGTVPNMAIGSSAFRSMMSSIKNHPEAVGRELSSFAHTTWVTKGRHPCLPAAGEAEVGRIPT